MTAYTFDTVTNIAKSNPTGTTNVVAHFSLTAGLANEDTIGSVPVPKGATIVSWYLAYPELDSDASPTGTIDVGDADDVDRFADGVVMGGSATSYAYTEADGVLPTVSSGLIATGIGYKYTEDSSILLTVSAAVATAATTGLVTFRLTYTLDAY